MSLQTLLARIDEQRGELEATAEEAESLRTAPPRLVDAMRAIEVPLAKVPREVGGYQLNPPEQLAFYEALAYANPTAGWVGFVHGGGGGMAGAHLPDAGAAKVFDGSVPFCAAVALPTGAAIKQGGNTYALQGRWRFASGVQHSDWIVVSAKVEGEKPPVRMFTVATTEIEIEDDWHVAALKGTGSVDVLIDTTVPDEMSWPATGAPKRGGGMYGMTSLRVYVAGENTGFSLGVAQRAIDEAALYSINKRGPTGVLAERGVFQYELGKADLTVAAARTLMREVLTEAWLVLEKDEAWDGTLDAKVSAAMAYATEVTANAVTSVFHLVGATALHNSHVLQRCLRDIHGATQHLLASNEAYEVHGRELIDRAGTRSTQ